MLCVPFILDRLYLRINVAVKVVEYFKELRRRWFADIQLADQLVDTSLGSGDLPKGHNGLLLDGVIFSEHIDAIVS